MAHEPTEALTAQSAFEHVLITITQLVQQRDAARAQVRQAEAHNGDLIQQTNALTMERDRTLATLEQARAESQELRAKLAALRGGTDYGRAAVGLPTEARADSAPTASEVNAAEDAQIAAMQGYHDSGGAQPAPPPDPIKRVVALIEQDGMIDGAHHKQWVLDQILRILLGAGYAAWRAEYDSDPDYADWDEGIAP